MKDQSSYDSPEPEMSMGLLGTPLSGKGQAPGEQEALKEKKEPWEKVAQFLAPHWGGPFLPHIEES